MTDGNADAAGIVASLRRLWETQDTDAEAVGSYWQQMTLLEAASGRSPDSVAQALADLAADDRDLTAALLEDLLRSASDEQVERLLSAVDARDPSLARRHLASDLSWSSRVRRGAALGLTAETLVQGHYDEDGDTAEWRLRLVEDAWALGAAEAWRVLAALGARPSARIGSERRGRQVWQHLWTWVLGVGPQEVYRQDPRTPPSPDAAALAEEHAHGFVTAVADGWRRGDDLDPWLAELGEDLPGCGVLTCCRPSLFEEAVRRRGFELRARRYPWSR